MSYAKILRSTRRYTDEKLAKLFPNGTRIELIEMVDDPNPVEPGTRGTVTGVCGNFEVIYVDWDNGRTTNLCYPEDRFMKIV